MRERWTARLMGDTWWWVLLVNGSPTEWVREDSIDNTYTDTPPWQTQSSKKYPVSIAYGRAFDPDIFGHLPNRSEVIFNYPREWSHEQLMTYLASHCLHETKAS